MEIRLDDFSASNFDVKEWVNRQLSTIDNSSLFADVDDGSNRSAQDSFSQKLITQLNFLATNSKQGNDRIKARFRHQAPQITRDIISLGKLVQSLQNSIDELSTNADSRSDTTSSVERITTIDKEKSQLRQSIAALEYLRDYANFPQRIESMLENGNVSAAWELIDKARNMQNTFDNPAYASMVSIDIERYEYTVRDAAYVLISKAISDHDIEGFIEARSLIERYESIQSLGSSYSKVRFVRVTARLSEILETKSKGEYSNFQDSMRFIADIISNEREFMEATEMNGCDIILEELLVTLFGLWSPYIAKYINRRTESDVNDTEHVLALYQGFIVFYSEVYGIIYSGNLRVGEPLVGIDSSNINNVPRSLSILLEPFFAYTNSILGRRINEFADRLQNVVTTPQLDYSRPDAYFRDMATVISSTFNEVKELFSQTLVFSVPFSKFYNGVRDIELLVSRLLDILSHTLDSAADSYNIPQSSLDDYSVFALKSNNSTGSGRGSSSGSNIGYCDFDSAIYASLTDENKLGASKCIIGLSFLSRVIKHKTDTLCDFLNDCWDSVSKVESFLIDGNSKASESVETDIQARIRLLSLAYFNSCANTADLRQLKTQMSIGDTISRLKELPFNYAYRASAAVFFVLSSAFRPSLSRLSQLPMWRKDRNNKSNMNIQVPLFSHSPSEEAIEIGERIHALLPELEQVEVMDIQLFSHNPLFTDVISQALHDPRNIDIYPFTIHSLINKSHNRLVYYKEKITDEGDQSAGMALTKMLSLVLHIFANNLLQQIGRIKPPLSRDGLDQLTTDLEYIDSVISSFASEVAPVLSKAKQIVSTTSCQELKEQYKSYSTSTSSNKDIYLPIISLVQSSLYLFSNDDGGDSDSDNDDDDDEKGIASSNNE